MPRPCRSRVFWPTALRLQRPAPAQGLGGYPFAELRQVEHIGIKGVKAIVVAKHDEPCDSPGVRCGEIQGDPHPVMLRRIDPIFRFNRW